jgi:pyruvate-ferredoxin/flavodoxin oxidoreductase
VLRENGENPFLLDSPRPRTTLSEYTGRELRYSALARVDPQESERLLALAQEAVHRRWLTYEEMATRPAHRFSADARK